jgi:hypothetical protein
MSCACCRGIWRYGLASYTGYMQVRGRAIDLPIARPKYPDIDTELHNGKMLKRTLLFVWLPSERWT